MPGRLCATDAAAAVLLGLLLSCPLPGAATLPNRAARAIQQTSALGAETQTAAAPASKAVTPAAAPAPTAEAGPALTVTQLLSLASCPSGLLSNGQPVPFLGPLRSVKAAGIEWGYHTFGPLVSAAGAAPPLLLLPGTVRRVSTGWWAPGGTVHYIMAGAYGERRWHAALAANSL